MFYDYILYSPSIHKFYTGQTKNLESRQEEHNRGKTRFLKSGKPWKLVYSVCFPSGNEAMKLENIIEKATEKNKEKSTKENILDSIQIQPNIRLYIYMSL